ncbi:MAG: DUF115 domain-containing protein [Bacteroides sp.]|nr:DUF115 domain-containing protein [Bacteroides sp.]
MSFKSIIKNLLRETRNTFNLFVWIIKQTLFENFKSYIKYQDLNTDTLIILANGPSLKNNLANNAIDFDNAAVCVVNDFARFPIFRQIKPQYYVLADPFYFTDLSNQRNIEIHTVFESIDWKMNLYIPFQSRKLLKGKINNPNITVIPFHSQPFYGCKTLENKLYSANLSMPRAQNVLIPAIYIGINNGFKKIMLYGVDHSWTEEIRVNSKNEVCFLYAHFFDDKKPDLKPWHKGTGLPVYKMHEILRDLAWMFDGYHRLQSYAELKGCRIINKTKDSFIDAFERE